MDESNEDGPDFWDDDGENDDGAPDYWECLCCSYTCGEPAWGGQCPKCGAHMEEGYF